MESRTCLTPCEAFPGKLSLSHLRARELSLSLFAEKEVGAQVGFATSPHQALVAHQSQCQDLSPGRSNTKGHVLF